MKWADIFATVEEFIPLFAGLTGHPELGALAQKMIDIGENELQRRMAATGMTRTQALADDVATYAQLKTENVALKKMGHEGESVTGP